MEISKIVGIGIIGTILAVTVKSYRAELGICVAIATGTVIFFAALPQLEEAFAVIEEICEQSEATVEYFKVIIKVIGIAYITQFAAELARDAGEGAVAKKLEFAGKASVLCVIAPVVKNLLDVITSTLMSF